MMKSKTKKRIGLALATVPFAAVYVFGVCLLGVEFVIATLAIVAIAGIGFFGAWLYNQP